MSASSSTTRIREPFILDSYHRRVAFPARGADPVSVARVLICEPHADVRSLLAFVVRRIGHEPVVFDGDREQARGVDAIVIEPGEAAALELASWARAHVPGVPVICTSILQSSP